MIKNIVFWLTIIAIVQTVLPASADDDKESDAQPRYEGPVFYDGSGSDSPPIEFDSEGIDLLAWLPLGEFDSHIGRIVNRANDIWGYSSASGREYAIIGLGEGVAFVEVTTPTDPQIIAAFSGPSTVWRDIKTYKHYAYVVGDGSHRDMQVYDLSQIDDAIVSHVGTVPAARTHNVAIDTTSGMLYRAGAGLPDAKGLMIYDINLDPADPVLVGQWNDRYIHDAQAVTYTKGPYAGRQIVFAFTGHHGGLDILDVTDKSSIELVSSLNYTHASYSHQGWLSVDRRYIYLGDEMDERNDPAITTTTTWVIDVADLSNPAEIGGFTNGTSAIDHNLFTRFYLIYESNYRSGLRIFDATDPVEPVEIAYFDTYPDDDDTHFNGLWGNYPYLPSRIVLGSDIEKGLFIWKVYAALEVPIEADIGIKPATLNMESKGKWITCYIRLPDDYDITDIDPDTVRIDPNGFLLEEEIWAEQIQFEEQEHLAVAKFKRSAVLNNISVGVAELTVSGELINGIVFEGTNTIRIIEKGGKK